jgi:hypothetical protein
MPKFSAFSKFGHLAFSGREPLAKRIYDAQRAALGGEENLPDAFDASHMAGTLYARAMSLATAQLTFERAINNRRPGHSTEAIEAHEKDWGTVPSPLATLDERRAALRAAELAMGPATESTIREALSTLLGADFVDIVMITDGVAPSAVLVDPDEVWDAADGPGTWLPPDTVQKWHRLDGDVYAGVQTVSTTHMASSTEPFAVGEQLVVHPGVLGRQERIVVSAVNGSSITATFRRPHEAGAPITSTPWPLAFSYNRVILVVVSQSAARSYQSRANIDDLMDRMLSESDHWNIVEESGPGTLGPFRVSDGRIGCTPIVSISI